MFKGRKRRRMEFAGRVITAFLDEYPWVLEQLAKDDVNALTVQEFIRKEFG